MQFFILHKHLIDMRHNSAYFTTHVILFLLKKNDRTNIHDTTHVEKQFNSLRINIINADNHPDSNKVFSLVATQLQVEWDEAILAVVAVFKQLIQDFFTAV